MAQVHFFATVKRNVDRFKPNVRGFGHDFSAANKKYTSRPEGVKKPAIQFLFYLRLKIDHDVATDDEIEFAGNGIGQQVMLTKNDSALQIFVDPVLVIINIEVA